jgi:hypothetical protein
MCSVKGYLLLCCCRLHSWRRQLRRSRRRLRRSREISETRGWESVYLMRIAGLIRLSRRTGSLPLKSSSPVLARSFRPLLTVCCSSSCFAAIDSCFSLDQGIGCAGEIRVSEHEDYEKWAIDILVKFRDSEKLQLLTAHRQSGGVRASCHSQRD